MYMNYCLPKMGFKNPALDVRKTRFVQSSGVGGLQIGEIGRITGSEHNMWLKECNSNK